MKSTQRWYRRHQLFNQSVPAELLPWLFDVSSLTARLIDLCGSNFSVRVISQSWQPLCPQEAAAMRLCSVRSALVRQVYLCSKDIPVVYARTVIPSITIKGRQRRYANLGNRPLGAMLFADRTMQREPVQVARLSDDLVAAQKIKRQEQVWGRRSVFRVAGRPMLVSEYFLPELFSLEATGR